MTQTVVEMASVRVAASTQRIGPPQRLQCSTSGAEHVRPSATQAMSQSARATASATRAVPST